MKDNNKTPKEHNPFNVFPDDASILSSVIYSAYEEAIIQDKIREEVRKETAKEILKELLFSVENCKKKDILWYIESISKRYGVELFGKTEQVGGRSMTEQELKPCPFCGSISLKIESKHHGRWSDVGTYSATVRCNKCHARGSSASCKVSEGTNYKANEVAVRKAIEFWNRRFGQ